MAQQGVEGKGMDEHSLARTGRMALYGGCVFGPGATLWYKFLQKKIVIPNKPNLEIVARVATDQTVFASTNLFLFLSSMAMMEGNDPKQALSDKYVTAVKKNWMVWPAVQFTNFKYVPLEHRVLVVNIVSLGMLSYSCTAQCASANIYTGWNCYLSYLNSSDGGEHSKVSSKSSFTQLRLLTIFSRARPTHPTSNPPISKCCDRPIRIPVLYL